MALVDQESPAIVLTESTQKDTYAPGFWSLGGTNAEKSTRKTTRNTQNTLFGLFLGWGQRFRVFLLGLCFFLGVEGEQTG